MTTAVEAIVAALTERTAVEAVVLHVVVVLAHHVVVVAFLAGANGWGTAGVDW